MPRIKLSEADLLKQDADGTLCKSCGAAAEGDGPYCQQCHSYWTEDAPAMDDWFFEHGY